jgi:SAF domain
MLLFAAMKTAKPLSMMPLFLLLISCHHNDRMVANDHIIVAVRDIPAGTVLQRSDLKRDAGWVLNKEGACVSYPSDVLGHKTLRPLGKGQALNLKDIEGTDVSSEHPHFCPDNVEDGWNGW